MAPMDVLRHIGIRRHKSLSERLSNAAEGVLVSVLSVFVIARGFWRRRAHLIPR
jgi:hypothetical protein